jgi:O-succinylbenzoic acid--CoA ligase
VADVDDLLEARAKATPDRLALIDADSGREWTFGEFDERVTERCDALREAIAGTAGRVGLLLDTGVAFAKTYFALGRLAQSVVALNTQLDAATLQRQATQADVGVFVTDATNSDIATDVAGTGASVVRPDGSVLERGTVQRAPEDAPDERLVMFTSGTTGTPKGVRLTQSNLVASAVGSAHRLGVDPADRWLICLPMYHMGGLAPLVRSTLYGTTAVLQRSFDAAETASVIESNDVTGVSLVPTMLSRLLDAGWHPPESLRFVLLGGAPASADLLKRSLDRGVPVYPTYGLTETASQVATATPADVRDDPDTVGRPLPTAEVTIADEGGPVGPGETGEIAVSGPVVTPGYLDAEQWTESVGQYGFRTGDDGYRDEAGRLRVLGRVDDRIVTGGENVAPDRVAAAIRALDRIEDAAVVGLPDDEWGERVAALVVGDAEMSSEGVRERLRGSLAAYELPKTVRFADGIPRTASGTVDREAVRERLRTSE